MTIGEIIYLEGIATERDQIFWATAAQEPKLLPKKKRKSRTKEVIQTMVSPFFQEELKEIQKQKTIETQQKG